MDSRFNAGLSSRWSKIPFYQTHAQSLIRFIFRLSTEFGHRLLLILDILLTNSHGFKFFCFFRLIHISNNSNLPSVLLKFIFVVLCQESIGSCLCLNLISAFLIIMLLQLVTPDHKLLLISFPQLSSKSTTKNYTQLSAHSRCKPPFFISREIHNHFPKILYYFKKKICDVISEQ